MSDIDAQLQRWDALHYPGTATLRNIPGIQDRRLWLTVEATLTAYRAAEVPITGFGEPTVAEEVSAIHAHIFQDCYTWAGQFRTVDIAKEDSSFIAHGSIADRLSELDGIVAALDELDYDDKLEVLAYTHSELNQIHPFPEGNGRTTRAFMAAIAARHDVAIEWREDHRALHRVSRESMAGEVPTWQPFHSLYRDVCTPAEFDDSISIDDILGSAESIDAETSPTIPPSFTAAITTMCTALGTGAIETTTQSAPAVDDPVQVNEPSPEL